MKIKKVIMSNGREYNLVWGDPSNINYELDDSIKMIDLEKGWVELNKKFISEIIPSGILKSTTILTGKARKEIIEHYGEYVINEE